MSEKQIEDVSFQKCFIIKTGTLKSNSYCTQHHISETVSIVTNVSYPDTITFYLNIKLAFLGFKQKDWSIHFGCILFGSTNIAFLQFLTKKPQTPHFLSCKRHELFPLSHITAFDSASPILTLNFN